MFNKELAIKTLKKYKEVIPCFCPIPYTIREDNPKYPKVPNKVNNKLDCAIVNYLDPIVKDEWSNKTIDEIVSYKENNVYKAFGYCTGERAGITIIDVDNEYTKQIIEKIALRPIDKISKFVIKTPKGYHLGFKYTPKLYTFNSPTIALEKNKINDIIDVLNDYEISGAIPYLNDRDYEFITNIDELELIDIPTYLIGYINTIINHYSRVYSSFKLWKNKEYCLKYNLKRNNLIS